MQRRGNFIYYNWGCTSFYRTVSYPFRSLLIKDMNLYNYENSVCHKRIVLMLNLVMFHLKVMLGQVIVGTGQPRRFRAPWVQAQQGLVMDKKITSPFPLFSIYFIQNIRMGRFLCSQCTLRESTKSNFQKLNIKINYLNLQMSQSNFKMV